MKLKTTSLGKGANNRREPTIVYLQLISIPESNFATSSVLNLRFDLNRSCSSKKKYHTTITGEHAILEVREKV